MPARRKDQPAGHEQLGQLLHVVAKSWRHELDRRLKPLGLTRTKWLALILMTRSGGGITQRSLAEKMEIGQPAMVALLDRLEKDELIRRNPMPGDRRASSLELTPAGKKLISKIEVVAHQLREEILAGFSVRELQTAGDVLARMKAKLEAFP